MRALAHPARLAILERLHVSGPSNATECARELETSPQAASYHLRALAKWGIVRRAESDDGRETRWELAARSIKFASGEDSQFRAAAQALGRRLLERDARFVDEYLAAEADFEREWREAATFSSGTIYVTARELEQIAGELHQLFKRYERQDEADRPTGSRRVHVIFRAVPRVNDRKSKRRK